ncbi:hypothetical protein EIP91_010041 [Steccherinum ochraceum]|uniref:F-box domain-containing protein n=1 Tax=Steccherinum ochraceum TaxID=92696 RepID=A0A4R0R6D2_9APHY|nr:hypothetical protein EIP91_010041 [Steccherinum ochraceum]
MDTHNQQPAPSVLLSELSVDELPYELLEAIFKEAVREDISSYFPDSYKTLRLSQVCRYWCSASQSSPRLWSIDLHYRKTAHNFYRFIEGRNATLYVAYAKDGGVKEMSVKIQLETSERFLRTVGQDLPGLERLDMYAVGTEWGAYRSQIDAPLPFLRSVTLACPYSGKADWEYRQVYQFSTSVNTLSLLTLLKYAPCLQSLRLEYCHINEVHPSVLHDVLQMDAPLPMTEMRSWTFVGINRLRCLLDNVVINPAQSVLAIDDIGSLNLMGELSAPRSREMLRGAIHTHLAITATSIETYSRGGGAYKFKRLRNHVTLVQALVSYGRAFHWYKSITHLSLNPDGSMLSASISTRADEGEEETWDGAMAPAWLKLFRRLTKLTHLSLTGFKIASVLVALQPREGKNRKTGEKAWKTSCSALDTIVLMDFAFGDYHGEEDDGEVLEVEGEACRFAKTDVEVLVRFFEARKQVDQEVRRVVLCHCLQAEIGRDALKDSVREIIVR